MERLFYFCFIRKWRFFRCLCMRKLYLFLLFLLPMALFGQRITPEEYIQTYKDIAMREMREHKIPASITLAQGLLESGAGNSALAREAKNHFGIKCHKGWTGQTYYMDDDAENECFRKYKNAEDSFKDHSEFLCGRSRYAALFDLEITDYRGWAKGLKAAGYATNPKYAQLLIDRIELYDLTKYDKIALGKMKDDNKVPEIAEEDELIELAYSPTNRGVFELVSVLYNLADADFQSHNAEKECLEECMKELEFDSTDFVPVPKNELQKMTYETLKRMSKEKKIAFSRMMTRLSRSDSHYGARERAFVMEILNMCDIPFVHK